MQKWKNNKDSMMKKHTISLFFILLTAITVIAQQSGEYGWKDVDQLNYQAGLPDPFLKPDGTRVKTKNEWPKQREYIKAMLEHYQYGEMPPVPKNPEVRETLSEDIFNGTATRKLYKMTLHRNGRSMDLHFGIVKPKTTGPFPVIIKNDRDVPDPKNHDEKKLRRGSLGIPNEALKEAIGREYIYCAFNREDLGSDIGKSLEKNRDNGIFPLYTEYNWGTIAAWAWGYQPRLPMLLKQF